MIKKQQSMNSRNDSLESVLSDFFDIEKDRLKSYKEQLLEKTKRTITIESTPKTKVNLPER